MRTTSWPRRRRLQGCPRADQARVRQSSVGSNTARAPLPGAGPTPAATIGTERVRRGRRPIPSTPTGERPRPGVGLAHQVSSPFAKRPAGSCPEHVLGCSFVESRRPPHQSQARMSRYARRPAPPAVAVAAESCIAFIEEFRRQVGRGLAIAIPSRGSPGKPRQPRPVRATALLRVRSPCGHLHAVPGGRPGADPGPRSLR